MVLNYLGERSLILNHWRGQRETKKLLFMLVELHLSAVNVFVYQFYAQMFLPDTDLLIRVWLVVFQFLGRLLFNDLKEDGSQLSCIFYQTHLIEHINFLYGTGCILPTHHWAYVHILSLHINTLSMYRVTCLHSHQQGQMQYPLHTNIATNALSFHNANDIGYASQCTLLNIPASD